MGEMSVLLIEDNGAVIKALGLYLVSQNYLLTTAYDGQSGIDLALDKKPEIIILDLSLPDMSGLQVCHELRKIGVKAPILVLSSDDRLATKLDLFAAGADDYLLKPFSLSELKARLNAFSRRINNYRAVLVGLKTPSLILDEANQCVIREGGEAIELRRKEYDILEYLIKNVGKTVSRHHLASYAWKTNEPWSNAVNVHISILRDKIDKPYNQPLITTIHGHGYRLEAN